MGHVRTATVALLFTLLLCGCVKTEDSENGELLISEHRPSHQGEPAGLLAEALRLAKTIPSPEDSGIIWESIGPHVVGGRTRGLAVDVENPKVLVAGGVTDGIWRSTDRGKTWTRVSALDDFRSVTSLAQDTRPGRTNVWYYGTGEQHGNSTYATTELSGGGIYKSTDGGLSWSVIPSTTTSVGFSRIYRVVVDPSNLDEPEVYAAGEGVIYRSVDGGETWQAVLGAPYEPSRDERTRRESDVAVDGNGMVLATLSELIEEQPQVDKGFWQSSDGINWTKITPPGFPETFGWTVIGMDPSRPRVAYFFGWGFDAGLQLLLYRYTAPADLSDEGGWEDLSHRIRNRIRIHPGYDQIVAVKPDNPQVIYVGGIGLIRTDDGFASEFGISGAVTDAANTTEYPNLERDRPSGEGETVSLHADQHAIVFDPTNPDVVYVGNDGGVYVASGEGARVGRWTPLNRGYVTTQFYFVTVDQTGAGTLQILGGTQDNGTWHYDPESPGSIWRLVSGADGFWAAFGNRTRRYYTSGQGGRIGRTELSEDGRTGSSESIRPTDIIPLGQTRLLLDPSDERIMYLPGTDRDELFSGVEPTVDYIWRNNRADETTGADPMQFIDRLEATRLQGIISGIAVTTGNPRHRLYYGTRSSDSDLRGRLFRLDDANEGQPIPVEITGSNFPDGSVSSITVDPNDGDRVFATFSDYGIPAIFVSEDAGATWTDVTGNLLQKRDGMNVGLSVQWLEPLFFRGDSLYFAGTTTGLFSTDRLEGSSTTWRLEGRETIGYARISSIDARHSDGYVAMGTYGSGVFTGFAREGGVGTEDPVHRQRTALLGNYPNPIGERTTFSFQLEGAGSVRLTVHDLQGRRAAHVADGTFGAGEHEITWTPGNLPNGVYVLRLRVHDRLFSRSIVIAQ